VKLRVAGQRCHFVLEAFAVLAGGEVEGDPLCIDSGQLGVQGGRDSLADGIARYIRCLPRSIRPHDDDPYSSFKGMT
jgi:hypothetical protein